MKCKKKWGLHMDKFVFKGLSSMESVCGVTRYGNVFVVTDADYAEGTSVTNGLEFIVTEIIGRYGVKPDEITVIEEIPISKARYSHVKFNAGERTYYGNQKVYMSSPEWIYMPESEFAELIESQ